MEGLIDDIGKSSQLARPTDMNLLFSPGFKRAVLTEEGLVVVTI